MALSLTCRRLLHRKKQTFIQCRNTGYIVLLPEVPRDEADGNALLRSEPLQEYSSLTPEKCYNGVVKRILDFNSAFWKLENDVKEKYKKDMPADELFRTYLDPLELISRPMENSWAVVKTLRMTNPSLVSQEQFRLLNSRAIKTRTTKFHSPLLYNSCKSALKNLKPGDISEDQERLLQKYVTEGKLNGMELSQVNYERLDRLITDLGKRQTLISTKLEVSTNKFKHRISDPNMVKNFPIRLLTAMSDSQDPRKGPWTVTLQPHIAKPFLEYCPDTLARWGVWRAMVMRGNEYDDNRTSVDIEEVRIARRRQAKLLGYSTYADMSMETKMAGSVENVLNMLDLLLEKARPAQAREIESLNKFALQNGFHKTLDWWDVPYWKRQQQTQLYSFDEESIRDYFPFDVVLNGLFSLAKDLFGIEIQQREGVDTWHPDVRFFDIFAPNSTTPIGHFYVDPYIRKDKLQVVGNKGWTSALRNHSTIGTRQIPHTAMIFNFFPPTLEKPSLLSLKEVTDLFGRFGHVLQNVLSEASYAELAGLSFVEWDAVDITSNFMVQWVYTRTVFERISCHYKTGEKMPTEFLDNLERIRRHMAGLALCNDVYLSRFDIEAYTTKTFWRDIMKSMWPVHFVFPLDKDDDHPLSFSDIFVHEWGAAYFSHLWARVIAADLFSSFLEAGLEQENDIAAVGKRFRETYLSQCGTSPTLELFRRFRGRDPSPDALLYWLGLQKPAKAPAAHSGASRR